MLIREAYDRAETSGLAQTIRDDQAEQLKALSAKSRRRTALRLQAISCPTFLTRLRAVLQPRVLLGFPLHAYEWLATPDIPISHKAKELLAAPYRVVSFLITSKDTHVLTYKYPEENP